MEIIVDDLSGPEIVEFLDEHIQEMRAVTPPESKHALDLDGRVPDAPFWTVMQDGAVVACAAVKVLDANRHGEIKSMRVAPSHRRSGVASTLLQHIISEARRMGLSRLFLETGSFRRPSEDGGLEESEESVPRRRSSSATLASSAAIVWAWTALTARNSAMIAAWTATVASRSTRSGEIVASEQPAGRGPRAHGPRRESYTAVVRAVKLLGTCRV